MAEGDRVITEVINLLAGCSPAEPSARLTLE